MNNLKREKGHSFNENTSTIVKEPISDLSQTKEFMKVLSNEISAIVEELLNKIYDTQIADRFAETLIYLYDKLNEKGLSKPTIERILCEYSANVEKLVSIFRKNNK
ncbi:MAG: hypothetical protein ACTSYD_09740 [Candidatus Heimdallarchaeaceae archaeon]